MNTLQRLFSNTLLAFIATAMVKVSNSILFILVGRSIGPEEAGVFNLGVTFYTIVLALSTWGLHELLVREAASRREQSGRYLVNYIAMRLTLSALFYGGLLLALRFLLPYPPATDEVIRIMTLTIFAEAIFSLCQALFTAHERLGAPTLGAIINSAVTLAFGVWALQQGGDATAVAWAIPLGMLAGLLVFPPALVRLFRKTPQTVPMRLNWTFCRQQLRYTPGFILLGIFSTLNFQIDTFIISLILTPADIGYYGAAQTILMGFTLMPVAIRTALYPLMARYKQEDPARLEQLYRKSIQYLLIGVLPIAMGITLLGRPIIQLVFGDAFDAAVPALQWTIWAIVFLFITVPPARLMLVYDQQQTAGWMRGLGMLVSVGLNLLLIANWGIVGAGIARVLAAMVYFVLIFGYVQLYIQRVNLLSLGLKPLLAMLVMGLVVWPLRAMWLPLPILAGVMSYAAAIVLLGVITPEDRYYLRQLVRARTI